MYNNKCNYKISKIINGNYVTEYINCNFEENIIKYNGKIENSYDNNLVLNEEELNLREQILDMIKNGDLEIGILKQNSKLYRASSKKDNWWEKIILESRAGGLFFSKDIELAFIGGKAPFGIAVEYTIKNNDIPLLYIPRRDELFRTEEEEEIHLVGDDIKNIILPLGFWGYYSCDECELFISNNVINNIIMTPGKVISDRSLIGSYTIR